MISKLLPAGLIPIPAYMIIAGARSGQISGFERVRLGNFTEMHLGEDYRDWPR